MAELTGVQKQYILHWGEMGTRWGINRTVAQIHALLFLSPEALPAEEIAETLSVARSNVSNSLKELQGWGLVKVVHTMGDRRDHFIDLLNAKFHVRTSVSEHDLWKGCTVYDAYPRAGGLSEKYGSLGRTKHFSFVAPSAGMFIWVSTLRVPPAIRVNVPPAEVLLRFSSGVR